MQYLNKQDGNNFISEQLLSNQKLCVCRLGTLELNAIYSILYSKSLHHNLIVMLQTNAGVYGDSINDFASEYIINIPRCNTHVVWEDNSLMTQQSYVFDKLCPRSIKIAHRAIEPFYFRNPWSQYLKNKKILVVSPFVESIINQYNNRTALWDNTLVLPSFELLTYRSVQSINNSGPHNGWLESLNIMKNDLTHYDFDIALLGCGAYGLPLVSFISNELNKTAIYIGGALQILFGIKGKRWDNHDEISKMYKSSWIRPSSAETPELSHNIENGCYW